MGHIEDEDIWAIRDEIIKLRSTLEALHEQIRYLAAVMEEGQ